MGVSGALLGVLGIPAPAIAGAVPQAQFTVRTILSGRSLHHRFTPSGGGALRSERLTKPDDITALDGKLFVGFQNGVGPQGEASGDGNQDSTVVEVDTNGKAVAQWDVAGKADGVTADPGLHVVIVTVNEDANSSLYTIDPAAPAAQQVVHYQYDEPLPHNGGTDAISIFGNEIFVSASAPGTAAPAPENAPAAYQVSLDASTKRAKVSPLFAIDASATVANTGPSLGHNVTLALTDPDSSEFVPIAERFTGDYVLDSQGDQEQIYVQAASTPVQSLEVLSLDQAIDDSAWPTAPAGKLYSTDSSHDAVDVLTGAFVVGQQLAVATPCGSNLAPATCPGPGFPANFLSMVNQNTGMVSKVSVSGADYLPQGGLVFLP